MKVSTEDYIRELKLIAHHLQEKHGEVLSQIQEPLLLVVELPNMQRAHFLIGSGRITYTENPEGARDKVAVSYRDLMRLLEKPSKAVRYLFEGRLKVSGNYQRVLSTLQKLL